MATNSESLPLNIYPEEVVDTRQVYPLDLGPGEVVDGPDIGPADHAQEQMLDDVTRARYIDRRKPNGIHCMDDRITAPGIQLPGGIGETLIMGQMMNPRVPEPDLYLSRAYDQVTRKAIDVYRVLPWWHNGCAAAEYKQDSGHTLVENHDDAIEFTREVMGGMGLVAVNHRSETSFASAANEAVYTLAERLDTPKIWDVSASDGPAIAARAGAKIETVKGPHRAAGWGIETAGNRYHNKRFMDEHTANGEPIGVLMVTMGAFRRLLEDRNLRQDQVRRDVMHASLFTYGVGKFIWSHYTHPIGIKARSNE